MARKYWMAFTLVGILVTGAILMILQPWISRVKVGETYINPRAQLDKDRSYKVVVWDYELPLPWSKTTHGEALAEAVRDFQQQYPQIDVELVLRNWDEGDGPIRDAIEHGNPPDVLGMPDGIRLLAVDYQIPLDQFLDDNESSDLFAAARRAASSTHLWGLPRWMNLARWMIWVDRWPGPERLISPNTQPPALSGDQWEDALANARTKAGRHGVAANLLEPSFFRELMISATGKSFLGSGGEVQWSEAGIQKVVTMLQAWVKRGFLSIDIESAARTRLARFWDGSAIALAPTTPWLIHHVLQRSGILASPDGDPVNPMNADGKRVALNQAQRTIVWSPPPLLKKEAAIAASISGYAVFRQADYKGHDHTQAAVLLAKHLSKRMGLWEASRMFVVPAHPSNVQEWLTSSRLSEHDLQALLTWSAAAVVPPVDDRLARLEARIMRETAIPNLHKVLKGQMTPEQFSNELINTPINASTEIAVP